MTNQQRAAAIAYKAMLDAPRYRGMEKDVPNYIAKCLAEAGCLMPDLPTDSTGMWVSGEWPAGFNYPVGLSEWPAHAYAYTPGEIGVSAPKIMSTDEAEALALAILAAVQSDRKHARKDTNG